MELLATASIFFIATLLMTVFFHVRYLNQYSKSQPIDYRAVRSGNWSDLTIWEIYDDGQWNKTSSIPNAKNATVFIPMNITIDLNQNVKVNNLFIEEGGSLNMVSGKVTIVKAFDQGLLSCNGTLRLGSSEVDGDGDVVVGSGSSLYCQMMAGNNVTNFQVTGSKSICAGVRYYTF